MGERTEHAVRRWGNRVRGPGGWWPWSTCWVVVVIPALAAGGHLLILAKADTIVARAEARQHS